MSETLIELQKEMRDLKQNNKGRKQGGVPRSPVHLGVMLVTRVETIKRSNKVVEKKVGVTERGQDDFDQSDPENLIEDISDDISSVNNPDDAYSDGQDSKLKAYYSEPGTDGSVNDKDEEKEAVYHCTVYSEEDTSQKKETKKVYQTPKDENSGPTVRKRCAPLLVLAPTKRKCHSFIRGDNIEKEVSEEVEYPKRQKFVTKQQATQTNVVKESKMVRIITKYVENGHQIEKVEEHETVWLV
ncbi:Hypothetical predicted protein [Mytilus galloprovincialis]|uniref:Uncharacterized protein n=1 Tax=Mytilus galloprovincialis TaxID=29158 RepID=A0A8B6EBW9_MYTGA|nr:Hypothetical predicted protein [Mytilus galloprovincialis]